MSVYMELKDLDKIFAHLTTQPFIVNRIDVSKKEEKDRLNRLLYTHYNGDSLDIVPTCDCGTVRGEYNKGIRCKICGTIVESSTERPLESLLWIECPEGVDTLINPSAWGILSNALTVGGCNVMEWLCNPMYNPTTNGPAPILNVIPPEWPRSLNFFYHNFDMIFDTLLKLRVVKRDEEYRNDLVEFVRMYRDRIFCKYLPFPSRIGFITEATPLGTFADTTMAPAIDAIRTITSISTSITPLSQRSRESRTVKAISQLSQYYRSFKKDTLGSKRGAFRKHIFGGRTHFTGRAVISSLSEDHHYEELHLPWAMSVQLYKIHLTNKLLKRGFSPREITEIFHEYVNQYSPLLDELFHELIAESPFRGLPVILQRNPSLVRGSAQRFYVTKVKTDVTINTISLSVLCLKAPNADFDGDELNLMAILDVEMHDKLEPLAPHMGTLDLRKPWTVSRNLSIPGPVLNTGNNWLSGG